MVVDGGAALGAFLELACSVGVALRELHYFCYFPVASPSLQGIPIPLSLTLPHLHPIEVAHAPFSTLCNLPLTPALSLEVVASSCHFPGVYPLSWPSFFPVASSPCCNLSQSPRGILYIVVASQPLSDLPVTLHPCVVSPGTPSRVPLSLPPWPLADVHSHAMKPPSLGLLAPGVSLTAMVATLDPTQCKKNTH
eukprot:Gb_20701 [translate_table: standard]